MPGGGRCTILTEYVKVSHRTVVLVEMHILSDPCKLYQTYVRDIILKLQDAICAKIIEAQVKTQKPKMTSGKIKESGYTLKYMFKNTYGHSCILLPSSISSAKRLPDGCFQGCDIFQEKLVVFILFNDRQNDEKKPLKVSNYFSHKVNDDQPSGIHHPQNKLKTIVKKTSKELKRGRRKVAQFSNKSTSAIDHKTTNVTTDSKQRKCTLTSKIKHLSELNVEKSSHNTVNSAPCNTGNTVQYKEQQYSDANQGLDSAEDLCAQNEPLTINGKSSDYLEMEEDESGDEDLWLINGLDFAIDQRSPGVIISEDTPVVATCSDDLSKVTKILKDAKDLKELSEDQLCCVVQTYEPYLRTIFQGKKSCRRHEDYKQGGIAKIDLSYQIPVGLVSDQQVEAIMDTLTDIFCKKHIKYLDYVMKVMFPEALVKLFMDVHDTSQEEAEQAILQMNQPPVLE